MIDNIEIEKKTKKYLNENFNVEYIDGPCFITYKTVDNKIYEKFYTVDSYLYKGIETLKKLDKTAGLKKLYVLKDRYHNILFQYNGNTLVRIRMRPIYENKRYKLKLKKYV